MTDNEKIQSFGDMVDAVERLTKPIQEENLRLHDQLNKVHKQMWWERHICVRELAEKSIKGLQSAV